MAMVAQQPPASAAPKSAAAAGGSTRFFGSQIGDQSVINYSYTDMPWKLLAWDIFYFFKFFWAIPYILLPANKPGSGDLDELSPTGANLFCIAVHLVLCVLQTAFIILLLPLTIMLPVWAAVLGAGACLALNRLICDTLLNGRAETYTSDPEYAPELQKHAHEQWIFLNGVAVGQHWLQNNLNRLALTFKRPILGIHNRTDGIIFDVVECLIQRNFGYATKDVRVCYSLVKAKLYDPQYSKVVLILHSQGGIEGGLVLDWLLQELPQNLLAKLEVYTFGNAANHFNNPYRNVHSQECAQANPISAAIDVTERPSHRANGHNHGHDHGHGLRQRLHVRTHEESSSSSSSSSSSDSSTTATSRRRHQPQQRQEHRSLLMRETSAPQPATVSDRAIGHVEHYAHTTDFVALWGVLHFATSATATASMPRFMGRVFARASERGGHQFCHHYLDGMFPLSQEFEEVRSENPRDSRRSGWWGSIAGRSGTKLRFAGRPLEAGSGEGRNEFMESEVAIGRPGDEASDVQQALESSWLGVLANELEGNDENGGGDNTAVTVHSNSPVLSRSGSGSRRVIKVKELSRLWQYRNGRSPEETPASLGKDPDGVVRGVTM